MQDGFDAAGTRAVVIAATNRKSDLDPALLSRFDMSILFDLPDERARCARARAHALSRKRRSRTLKDTPQRISLTHVD